MSSESDRVIRAELIPGERLLWSGSPRQGLLLRPGDAFTIPFSLLWGGFAFFWEFSVISKGAPFFFSLWGIPFVLIGIYIIVGRFFVDSYQRSRTFYGVTDHRILIVAGLTGKEIKSLSLATLSEISFKERADGSGTIMFGPSNPMYAMWSGTAWPGMGKKLAPAFDAIDSARKVYDLVRNSQRKGER